MRTRPLPVPAGVTGDELKLHAVAHTAMTSSSTRRVTQRDLSIGALAWSKKMVAARTHDYPQLSASNLTVPEKAPVDCVGRCGMDPVVAQKILKHNYLRTTRTPELAMQPLVIRSP